MAIKKIVQQRRNETNTDWDILHAETSADVVLYDDAETQLDASNVQEAIGVLQELINETATPLSFNAVEGTYDLPLLNDVVLQVGQELHFYGKAVGNISNVDVVMFAGAQGDHILVTKANLKAAGFQARWVIGVATQDIVDGEFGYITWFGYVEGWNKTAAQYPAGTILYADPNTPGGYTSIRPIAPDFKITMAAVVRPAPNENAPIGRILVRPDFSYRLQDLHDVHAPTPVDGQALIWDASNNRWQAQGIESAITDLAAENVAYSSQFHNIDNNVKEILDGLLYLFRFVNLYINGGASASTYYTGSFIDGGSSSTVNSPNAIMDAGYSQEYNQP